MIVQPAMLLPVCWPWHKPFTTMSLHAPQANHSFIHLHGRVHLGALVDHQAGRIPQARLLGM